MHFTLRAGVGVVVALVSLAAGVAAITSGETQAVAVSAGSTADYTFADVPYVGASLLASVNLNTARTFEIYAGPGMATINMGDAVATGTGNTDSKVVTLSVPETGPWTFTVHCTDTLACNGDITVVYRCPRTHYLQSPITLTDCVPCPESTLAPMFGAATADDCACAPGFATGTGGQQDCLPCPDGAECLGGAEWQNTPFPQPGFWREDTSDGPRFVQCVPESACVGGMGNECADGYGGFACGACDKSSFRLGSSCTACPTDATSRVIAGLVFIAAVGVALWWLTRALRYSGTSTIVLDFLQIAALFLYYQVGWPTSVLSGFAVLSVFNLNLQLLAPDCLAANWNFFESVAFQLAMPVIYCLLVVLACVSIYAFKAIWHRFFDTRIDGWKPSELYRKHRMRRWTLKQWLAQAGTTSFGFLVIAHVSVSAAGFSYFGCARQPSGTSVLTAEPAIVCGQDDTWLANRAYAALALALYVLGVPAVMAAGVGASSRAARKAYAADLAEASRATAPSSVGSFRRKPKKDTVELQRRLNAHVAGLWGVVWGRYQPEAWYWEPTKMVYKSALAATAVMLAPSPLIQASVALFLIVAYFLVQMRVAPYKGPLTNKLAGALTLAQGFLILMALISYNRSTIVAPALLPVLVFGGVLVPTLLGAAMLAIEAVFIWRTFPRLSPEQKKSLKDEHAERKRLLDEMKRKKKAAAKIAKDEAKRTAKEAAKKKADEKAQAKQQKVAEKAEKAETAAAAVVGGAAASGNRGKSTQSKKSSKKDAKAAKEAEKARKQAEKEQAAERKANKQSAARAAAAADQAAAADAAAAAAAQREAAELAEREAAAEAKLRAERDRARAEEQARREEEEALRKRQDKADKTREAARRAAEQVAGVDYAQIESELSANPDGYKVLQGNVNSPMPEAPRRSGKWEIYKNEDNEEFYYNTETGATVWEKPSDL